MKIQNMLLSHQSLNHTLIILILTITSIVPATAHATLTDTQVVASVIAAEAAGEGVRGMKAVANVIANRARKQGKTPYQIVTQRTQFYGYTAKNRMKLYKSVRKTADSLSENIYELNDITGGALFFRQPQEPIYSWHKVRTVQVGNHIFYK